MEKSINDKFEKKVKELEEKLPHMIEGVNCAELTLTSILDVLGVDNFLFHNIAKPLAGGFGGYKSKKGWMGACGAIAGGCAAIGAIMGGRQEMDDQTMAMAYLKAAKYATDFENQFGTVICKDLCGYDFSTPEGFLEYRKHGIWEKTCYKYVVWAVDRIRKLNRKDLKRKWD